MHQLLSVNTKENLKSGNKKIIAQPRFGDRLNNLRNRYGVKQKEIGKILGYGASTISNYESEKNNPGINELKKLADFFKVSIDYLVGYSDTYINCEKQIDDLCLYHLIYVIQKRYGSFSKEEFEELEKFIRFLVYKRTEK